jgi:glycosyltransferase involved in cell wall biosynthesis
MATELVAVIPAFNCAATVGEVVAGALRHVDAVVVVNDGSSDETSSRARHQGAEVEDLAENHGKGFALRRGIRLALDHEPQAVVLMDADGQHDPRDLPALIETWRSSRAAMVIGARLADVEVIPAARYWTNYIGSRVLSWMTGLELEDSQSGFRLLDARLAEQLPLISNGYAIESEMLIKVARRGGRVAHARVRTIYNDQGSHFRPVVDTFRISCASIYFKVFDDL